MIMHYKENKCFFLKHYKLYEKITQIYSQYFNTVNLDKKRQLPKQNPANPNRFYSLRICIFT